MTQVNYNDGFWHGWNGGECPVHPLTVVEVIYLEDGLACLDEAMPASCDFSADADMPIIAFRVIKEHREPSDFWIGYNWVAYASLEAAHGSFGTASGKPIHVREVLE